MCNQHGLPSVLSIAFVSGSVSICEFRARVGCSVRIIGVALGLGSEITLGGVRCAVFVSGRHTQQLLAREQRAAPFAASALDAVQLRMTAAVDRVFLARPLRSDAHQRAVSARGDAVDERRDLAV